MKQERETERREHRNNQQQPHQKCPRCDSYNTKFCYYNNYSLSQPRYYCKTCRRYWTQGGVIRNVPVGSGCRKGKRSKTSTSSGETSRSSQPPPQLPLQQPSPVVVQNNPYYQGGAGGLLSSLPAIQSLNKPINPLCGNYIKGPLNLALLKGYSSPNYGSQQHHHQQSQFFQIGNNGDENMDQDWHQQRRFINYSATTNTPTPSDGGLWNINSSSITATTSNTDVGSSLSPNQWHGNLPGYGPPPQ